MQETAVGVDVRMVERSEEAEIWRFVWIIPSGTSFEL